MKRNIFIRMVCLLLCVSMLTPVAASAGGPKTPEKVITNEMHYVNQFFTHAGGRSTAGKALEKWLDMGIREEGSDRVNSGYLMLEQEIEYEASSLKYKFLDTNVRAARKSLETVSTFGLNLAAEAITEAGFQLKYPGAGYSAYIYYQNLYSIYNEYVNEVMISLVEADQALDLFEAAMGEVVEYGSDYAYANCSATTGALVFVGKKVNSKTGVFASSMTDFTYTKTANGYTDVLFHIQRENGSMSSLSLDDLVNNYFNNGIPVTIDIPPDIQRKLDMKVLNDVVDSEFTRIMGVNTPKNRVKFRNLRYQYVDGFLAATDDPYIMKHMDDVQNVDVKTALSNSRSKLTEQRRKRAQSTKDQTSDIGGILVDSTLAGINMVKTSAEQSTYMQIVSGITDTYVAMLDNWYKEATAAAATRDKGANKDIQAALKAIKDDIQAVEQKAVTAHIIGDTFVMNMGNLSEVFLGVFEGTSYFQKFKDFITQSNNLIEKSLRDSMKEGIGSASATLKKYADTSLSKKLKKVINDFRSVQVNPMIAASIYSMVLNASTDAMVKFGDQASTVYYTKWSLRNLLLNPGGLLDQYIENPTHEKACAVIEALNTMKVAKYYGENMVLEYYLEDCYDMYDDLGIESGGNLHTLLWNEMMLNKGDDLPSIADVVEPITIVYESETEPTLFIWVPDKENIEIVGMYVNNRSNVLKYEGRQLGTFSYETKLSDLTTREPESFTGATVSEGWLKGEKLAARPKPLKYRYKCSGYIYSRNGISIILTSDEFRKYEEARLRLKQLYATFDDEDCKINFFNKDKYQTICRLEWTFYTRQWIESFEMYNSSENYKTHKIRHGSV